MMARTIMIQGTMSNAGKSLLAAGLCRIFKQDGYRVAPFKSQNMALNSYITEAGLEMGRAQVMQAQACGIEPDVRMNPILLKPTNDVGSQVIVNGEVLGNMSARDYFAKKRELIPDIMKAFNSLSEEYDIIVIEGAGSPAEINLKNDDIVNMGMAEMADAPVLIVGDIDRGGVFAQLVGTVQLLTESERARVKGLIINKFRGDKTILDPGVEMLTDITGIPVVGVVPYERIDVEDEDSLSERFDRVQSGKKYRENCAGERYIKSVNVAVVKVPRISNFTDFLMLENHDEVNITYVTSPSQLEAADMIILPGTKNTMGDLKWLRTSGMEAAIKKAAARGAVVFGICGGYQMLGESISDPEGMEEGGVMQGMGLLPMTTEFGTSKMRARVSGCFGEVHGILSALSGKKIEGYEIHMGASFIAEEENCSRAEEENCSRVEAEEKYSCVEAAGNGNESGMFLTEVLDSVSGAEKREGMEAGNVYGSYIHGIFDSPEVVDGIVAALKGDGRDLLKGEQRAASAGVASETTEKKSETLEEYRNRQFDKLASVLRESMDIEAIYEAIGLHNADGE